MLRFGRGVFLLPAKAWLLRCIETIACESTGFEHLFEDPVEVYSEIV